MRWASILRGLRPCAGKEWRGWFRLHLNKVEIRNFKSILDRQVINLSKGLTVVTGRNGSGKCIAPWMRVVQPWGEETIESIFENAWRNGLSVSEGSAEYAIPLKEIILLSYHQYFRKPLEISVSAIFRKPYEGLLLGLETSSGRAIEVTPEHKLAVASGNELKWVAASRLLAGTRIIVLENGKPTIDFVDAVLKKRWRGMVYDMYVRGAGCYVIEEGIIVHNSNLVDAIRFALGENNPRLLRTDRLSSLVNDNAGKEAEAYVRVTIDNSDSTIPGQDEIITIARRMGRDGESTYYLNGRRTTRNIVEDIISSAGLSARGYNIILQGEISRLADKNPVERRKEIEQALGLAQYDEKKNEALNNLQQADNNLRIAQARFQEIDRRMLQLERERNLLLRRRILENEVERLQLIRDSLEYWRILWKLEDSSKKIDESSSLKKEFEVKLAAIQCEKKRLMEKVEELLKVAPAARDSEIRLEYELKDYERRIDEGRRKLTVTKRELRKVRRKRSRLEGKIKRLSKVLSKLLHKHFSINSWASKLSDERRRLQEVEKKLSEEVSEVKSRLTLIEKELEKTILEERENERVLKDILIHYSSIKKRMNFLNKKKSKEDFKKNRIIEKITDLDETLAERRRTLNNIMSTLEILTESLDAFRMFFARTSGVLGQSAKGDVRAFLEFVKKSSGERGLTIYGVLRDNLWFPENIRKAVESLAEEWMDSILVGNSLDMLVLINLLSEKGLGIRVLTSEGEAVKKEIPNTLSGLGTHMMDLFKYPKNVEKHVLKLFGNSVLANGVEEAMAFAKNGFRAATLEGQVFTIEGASTPSYADRELINLLDFTKSFAEKAGELALMIKTMDERIKPFLNEKILGVSEFRKKLAKELNSIDLRVNELENQLRIMSREYLFASRRLGQVYKRHGLSKKRSLEKERLKLKSLIVSKEEGLRRIRKRIRMVEEELKRLEDDRTRAKGSLVMIEGIVNSLRRRIVECKSVEDNLTNRIIETRREIMHLANLANELKSKNESLKKNREIEVEYEESEEKLIEAMQKLDNEVERLNAEINRLKDAERKLLVEKEVNENKLGELRGRILGQPMKVPEEMEGPIEQYLRMLRSELEKVEEVNMLAIKQYEQEIEFYRRALERINELEEERRSIQEFMEDIERRKREAFLEGLNKINNYFSMFFNKMTGGEGWLEPEEPENPLETGLNVYVKFPGKEARVISGVSGGEKSVAALCLVFAMQKLFPAAFYIFDEPDAHLDYVNVERMTDLLKEVSKDSQMIIISLRDVVVSKADKVVGVYVKKGSSRFIEMPSGKALEEMAVVQ
jgi:chromosome segregation protein